MEFPAELREKINALCMDESRKRLANAAAVLSRNYREETRDGKISASSLPSILAYCAVRMSATFGAVSRALELALECFDGEISSILDVGAGTGAAAISAAMITGCGDVTLIEREQNMIDIGKELLECVDLRGEWIKRDISEGIDEKADLVICSYCLNEMPEKQREKTVRELMRAADKLLIIVEPGTSAAFEGIREIRNSVLDGGFKIAAPCPHGKECPIEEGDWCHFSARVARSKLHKQLKDADVPFEDEKFCFIAAAREGVRPCGGRILRRPLIQPSRITLRICGDSGAFTEVVTKSSPRFKQARKSDAGDEF